MGLALFKKHTLKYFTFFTLLSHLYICLNFQWFICNIQKYNQFLHIHPVFWDLTKSSIISQIFFCRFLRNFYIDHHIICDCFVLIPLNSLYLFSFLIVSSRTLSIMLNRSGKSWYLCLVPVIEGKACVFSPFSIMWLLRLKRFCFILSENFSYE